MLYFLPIEPLEERYTAQWYEWFPQEFRRHNLDFEVIDGKSLTDRVKVGTFLDINSTLYYKAEQLQYVAILFHTKQVKDGDVFFVADVEFWGIEAIKYLADLNGVRVKIYGFAHAGSYTREDFVAPCEPYALYYERAWGAVFDGIFVGSEYHKRQLCSLREIPAERVIVTGNPYDINATRASVTRTAKLDRVIHTNRPDPEKRPGVTLDLFEKLKALHPDWELMVTTSRRAWGQGELRDRALSLHRQKVITVKEGLRKLEYLTLLAESKVMTGNTIEENFGYCILESLIFDTIPIVPNDFSHPQLLDGDARCLFNDVVHQLHLIESAMSEPFSVREKAERYRRSLEYIVHVLARAME